MNFALTDEQEFLREAARGTLARVVVDEAAREALEGAALLVRGDLEPDDAVDPIRAEGDDRPPG